MKALQFKYIFFALALIPLVVGAHVDNDKLNGRYTKEKTIKKEYNVNSDALFKVKNSYGNLNITSWNENRVVIEVHIKTNGNDEDRVQERLNEIDVDFENNPSMVSAITRFGDRKNSWGWSWGNRKKVSVQVN
jgi:16S rRNA C967 or C1407 C5-methylase (RsmB/RsmF family)